MKLNKKWIMFGMSLLTLLAAIFHANVAIFNAWRTAADFPNANIPLLTKWFYTFSFLSLLSFVLAITFFIKGIKTSEESKGAE